MRRAEIVSIQSSVLDSSSEGVVLFSLLFRHGPNPEVREALRAAHVVLRNVLAGSRSEARFREAYRGLVNKLLEPGLQKRTALKTHCFNVGRMARKLAAQLGVTPMEVEQITVAAHPSRRRHARAQLRHDLRQAQPDRRGDGPRAPASARRGVSRRGHSVAVPDRPAHPAPPRAVGRRRLSRRPEGRRDPARLAPHPFVRSVRRHDVADARTAPSCRTTRPSTSSNRRRARSSIPSSRPSSSGWSRTRRTDRGPP